MTTSLTLHFHPLSSFSHKALIALYENGTPFGRAIVDFADAASMAAFRDVWPMMKMPVLQDAARGHTIPESTVIIEYLDRFHPGGTRFVPDDPDIAWQVRLWDRFFDHFVQHPMQKIVADTFRPAGQGDAAGVGAAREQLDRACALLEQRMERGGWAVGDTFTLADCAAAPALFYADTIAPFASARPALRAYLDRLAARPSVARVLTEAEPFFGLFPLEPKPVVPAAART